MALSRALIQATDRIADSPLSRRVLAVAATGTAAAALVVTCGGAALAATPAHTAIATVGARTSTTAIGVQLNCAASPHACGYPDATNTGVQPGHTLVAVPAQQTSGPGWTYSRTYGAVLVTGNGANLSDLAITGNLDIKTSNVTIDNVQVVNSGNDWGIGLMHAANALIEHSQVYSPAGADRLQVAIKDIYGDSTGTAIQTTNIWDTDTAIQVSAGTIAGNYVHDLEADPGDHVNGIVSDAGVAAGLTINHNTVFNPVSQTDDIALFEDFGQQLNATVTNNLLSGGGYAVYGGANAGKWTPTNIVITGNRFARTYYPNGGSYGPAAAVATSGQNGNTWTGNIWDNTGAPVTVS
jgi:hypothetical protein